MPNRKLVAALACRAGGGRLYGKPLQNIDIKNSITILDHLIDGLKACDEIDEIVLGISEGDENEIFVSYAHKHQITYIIGDQMDVLWRLIQCGRIGKATDVFRITSECPFVAWELVPNAWDRHVTRKNDITVTDYLPEGMNFEIYTLDSLELSHTKGGKYERSEFCSAYARKNSKDFKIEIVSPSEHFKRLDLRLTVDYPEDLIVCRNIYNQLKQKGPHIPMDDIIGYLDKNPHVHKLVEPFVDQTPIWASILEA